MKGILACVVFGILIVLLTQVGWLSNGLYGFQLPMMPFWVHASILAGTVVGVSFVAIRGVWKA